MRSLRQPGKDTARPAPRGQAPGLTLAQLIILGGAAWAPDEAEEAVRLLGKALEHLRHTATAGSNGTVAQCLALSPAERGAWTAARTTLEEAGRTAVEAGLEGVAVASHASGERLPARPDSARYPKPRDRAPSALHGFGGSVLRWSGSLGRVAVGIGHSCGGELS